MTGIMVALAEFVPCGVPYAELWPGVNFAVFSPGPPDPALRASLGIGQDEKIVVYPGSSHFANAEEMAALYEAIFSQRHRHILSARAHGARHTGIPRAFSPEALARHVQHLGLVVRARLPGLLRLADALVQPGRADDFNRYRLPSKLPEFLASGRPVVLPRVNVGLRVRPGREAVILQTGEPAEVTARCQQIFANPGLATGLSVDGAAFSRRWFDPVVNARGLARFYRG